MLVHLADQRADLFVRELVHAVAQEPFVLGENRQGLHSLECYHRRIVRRIGLLTAALFAVTLHASPQTSQAQPPPQPPPVFRAGTNLVQVDAIVTDPDGHPLVELTAADFELLGRRQADDDRSSAFPRRRRLFRAHSTPAPIRTHDDEEREASRDDVRVYAIVLDDYHVQRMEELRVIEPLLAFVRQLPPTDLVAVYYPLDSVTDVAFTRDREAGVEGDSRASTAVLATISRSARSKKSTCAFRQRQSRTIRRQIVHVGARWGWRSISDRIKIRAQDDHLRQRRVHRSRSTTCATCFRPPTGPTLPSIRSTPGA